MINWADKSLLVPFFSANGWNNGKGYSSFRGHVEGMRNLFLRTLG